jgi:hypothetical protein
MEIGMLWYDGDPSRRMDEKVERAATYYRNKYGRSPNLCLIHPQTAGQSSIVPNARIEVRFSDLVLRDHFWVGIRPEESEKQKVESSLVSAV